MAAETCPVMKGGVSCFWEAMWRKLDSMRQLWQLCDVVLLSEDKEMFMAHSPVLAASSRVFHSYFVERVNGIIEVQPDKALLLRSVQRDVLQITLDFIYGKTPTTVEDFEKLITGTEMLKIDGAGAYCKQKIVELSRSSNVGNSAYTFRVINNPSCEPEAGGDLTSGRDRSVIMYKPQGSPPESDHRPSKKSCSRDTHDIDDSQSREDSSSHSRVEYPQFRLSRDQLPHTSTVAQSPLPPEESVSSQFSNNSNQARTYQTVDTDAAVSQANNEKNIGFSTPLGLHIPPPLDLHHGFMADMSLNDLAKNIECPHLRRMQQSQGGVETMDTDSRDAEAGSPMQKMDASFDDHSLASDKVFCTELQQRSQSPQHGKPLETFHYLRLGLSSPDDLDDSDSEIDVEQLSSGELSDDEKDSRSRYKTLSSLDSGDSALDSSHNLASSEDSLDIDADLYRYRKTPAFIAEQSTSPFSSPTQYDSSHFNQGDSNTGVLFSSCNRSFEPVAPPDTKPLQPVPVPQYQSPDEVPPPALDWTNERIVASLKIDSETRVYSCLVSGCDYTNKHLDYMRSHLFHRHNMGVPTHPCSHCTKAYFSDSQLNNHVKRTHDRLRSESGGSSVHCTDCKQVFQSVYKLQTHQLKVHGKGKLFTCDRCAFKSPRKKDVQAHMLSQHGEAPPGVRVYSCPFCDYKCIDRNRYEEHEAMHTGEQKHQCSECSKSYTTRRGLRTHQKYHSEERPYHCEECSARFKVRSKLKDHVKLVHTHPGVKPYQCGYCSHRTALRGNCNQHIKKHHPGFPVNVIDHLASQRKSVKDYDYAQISGAGIEECRDVRAARWASIGNSANFYPPAGPVGVIDVDVTGSESIAGLVGAPNVSTGTPLSGTGMPSGGTLSFTDM